MIKIGDILEGKISVNQGGSASFTNETIRKNVYIHKKNINQSLHLDTVRIKIVKGIGRAIEGVVLNVIKRFKNEFVGTLQKNRKYGLVKPDNNKIHHVFRVPKEFLNGATNNQKVIVRLTSWTTKGPNGEIVRVIGDSENKDTQIHSILEEYNLPYEFNENVNNESLLIKSTISQDEIDKRRDMRSVTTLTIDPHDAKDFDDALSFDETDNEINIGIHIADVSHYVRPECEIDKEAYKRGTSIYLVDRVIPMLPEILSNEICSLKPNEDKLCFSVIFTFDFDYNIKNVWCGRTIINSDKRYTYESAQEVMDSNLLKSKTDFAIIKLNKIAKYLKNKRKISGSVSFDKGEIKFRLNQLGEPEEIYFKSISDSNNLIEEFMLLANKHVSSLLKGGDYPVVNRVHEEPNQDKLIRLRNFIKLFGHDIDISDVNKLQSSINELLDVIKDKPEAEMISRLIVRSMQKAFYSTKDIGHYGLGFPDYSHFTSPIRRYPDIMLHRLLGRFLEAKTAPKMDKIESKCQYLSEQERKAQKAERESIKYMQCLYMSKYIGMTYKAILTSINDFGVFVELIDNKCDGILNIDSNSNIKRDTNKQLLIDKITGEKIMLASIIDVVVDSVDIQKKEIKFELLNNTI